MKRRWTVLGLWLGLAPVASATAPAGSGGPILRFNPADQAAARAALIHRSDLRPRSDWEGDSGPVTKADLAPLSCPGYHPNASDLVVTGAASSSWHNVQSPLAFVFSFSEVLKTQRMVRLDWQRSIQPPAATACFGKSYVDFAGGGGGKLVSFKRVSFPRIARYTAAFEGLVNFEWQQRTFFSPSTSLLSLAAGPRLF